METKFEVTNLITPFINTFKTVSNELKHAFNDGLEEYLRTQAQKYSLVNTFLHRIEKVKFKDIYFPLKATYKKLTTDFEDINELFGNYHNIVLIGNAGSGKSTLLKYVFFQVISKGYKVPIVIEFRMLNEYKGSFEDYIIEKILKTELKPSLDTFKRSLRSGKYIFLLDGYDEIHSTKKQDFIRQIDLFVDAYGENDYFITTRPGSGIEIFGNFFPFTMEALDSDEIQPFIKKMLTNQEREDRLIAVIRKTHNNTYKEYLKNPLLLSMFILTFESHPEIPSKKSAFFRNVFDTLYSKHDGLTKNGFPRERLSKLQREDFEKVLNIFSWIAFMKNSYLFTEEYLVDTFQTVKNKTGLNFNTENLIYDLRTSISIFLLDGFEYSFPHRSLQEYFTAQFIASLTPEKKEKAYAELFKRKYRVNSTVDFNLIQLLLELDRAYMIKKIIIPTLSNYSKILTEESDFNLLEKFLNLSTGMFTILVQKGEVFIVFGHSNGMYINIVNYFGVCDSSSMSNFPGILDAQKEMKEIMLRIQSEDDKYLKIDDTTIHTLLVNHNIVQEIRKYRFEIDNKIESLKLEIQQEESGIDDILNI